MLKYENASITENHNSETLFHQLVFVWHKDPVMAEAIFSVLLKAKGDPNQVNNNGFSAFQLAVKRGHLNVAQSMIRLGLESEVYPKLNINLKH